MKFYQVWQGINCREADLGYFPVTVPGNIQEDYGKARGFRDVMFSDNYKQYLPVEDDHWEYRTELSFVKNEGERVFFVSKGMDYKYDILLNGETLYSYEGIYRHVELDLTDYLKDDGNLLTVHIYPHPKRDGAPVGKRDEADASCKPPVSYGWDWNPRLLISGLWQEAYVETRAADYLDVREVRPLLSEDLATGYVTVDVAGTAPWELTLYDAENTVVYRGSDTAFAVSEPQLWWCNGQGTPYLYRWEIRTASDVRTGKLGFRRIRLLRNEGDKDPKGFPKSRYNPAMTLELNGRRIFAKGTNWVNPDIFWGKTDRARYDELVTLARDANMNIFRMWGGASVAKDDFYELCDEYGLMVWQEFMLACNDYPDTAEYLATLESEATWILRHLRSHPSLVLWCGGNELFNGWSGMDEQSLPLRLLNKLCYENDPTLPFLPTSPMGGVGHGGYLFYSPRFQDGEVFEEFQRSHCTAYTEFGVPSISSVENLKKIIPADELFPIRRTDAWIAHHGFDAWGANSWVCPDVLEHYFGELSSLEETVAASSWLQCEGYRGVFEEARRQWPHCSMAINWCYEEPWITAANNSIIEFPTRPKPAYEYVKKALRPTLFSAKIGKFIWKEGETFEAELWLLNDQPKAVSGKVSARLRLGDEVIDLLDWNASAAPNRNHQGPTVRAVLPSVDTDRIVLELLADDGMESTYVFQYRRKTQPKKIKTLNNM